MSLRDLMLADLERGLAIVRDGHEIIPAWRILTPDGDFLILTRFDPDQPDQRERMLALVPRFMAWKLATAFVLTAETWLGPQRTRSGEEAVLTHRRVAPRTLGRDPANPPDTLHRFAPAEWLGADAIDEHYFRLLPVGQSAVTAEEAAMLADVFGEDGELPAQRLN